MKKKILIAVLVLALALSAVFAFTLGAGAEEADPALSIGGKKLVLGNSIYLTYMVSAENVSDVNDVSVLVWNEAQDAYVKGTEKYEIKTNGKTTENNGVTYYEFVFEDVAAKRLADDFYAVAYTKVGDTEYYSAPNKYSVLQYAYNMMGKLDKAASTNTNLLNMLDAMLDYGATAQYYFDNYKTDRLANADFYQVKVEGGKLSDGFADGLYLEGDKVTITANAPEAGKKFAGWLDGNSGKIVSTDMTTTVEVGDENAVYTATYKGDITLSKTSSHTKGRTASIGDKITYYITVNNEGSAAQNVVVKDIIPANTTYAGGELDELTWTVAVEANSSKTISYTVKVNKDTALYGESIEATVATAGEAMAAANVIYIEKTINSFDDEYVEDAIDALQGSTYKDRGFASWVYYVFTSQQCVDGTVIGSTFNDTVALLQGGTAGEALLDMIAPSLYGGTTVEDKISGIKGTPNEGVLLSDLVSGDIIIVNDDGITRSYMYSTRGSGEITNGFEAIDINALLSTIGENDFYAVIRPSIGFTNVSLSDPDITPDELNEKQQAVIDTARYYLLRGQWLQYDDTYYQISKVESPSMGNESRWTSSLYAPEEYTRNDWGYINCAAFTSDVYWTTFGKTIGMNTTSTLASSAAGKGMLVYKFTRTANQAHTEEEMAEVTNAFLTNLEPGDLMVVRRGSSSGHVMIYMGNGMFIHSTGGSYDYNDKGESFDVTIRYHRVYDYFLSGVNQSGYIFGEKVTELHVVRPLQGTTYKNYNVSTTAQNRLDNLQGIIAEKLVSVKEGVSVNPGDNITYTIRINNTNTHDVTLNVTDVVPTNTTYVSGGDVVNGNNLSWTVTVPARQTVELTFTVKVNANAAFGQEIVNDTAKIAGVPFKTYHTFINGTLTAEQQQTLIETFNSMKSGNTLTGLAFVNALYKKAFGIDYDIFDSTTHTTVFHDTTNGVFTDTYNGTKLPTNGSKQMYTLNTGSKYNKFLVDNLYGGRRLITGTVLTKRHPLPTVDNLVIGDIFVRRISSGTYYTYLYIGGDTFVNVSTTSLAADTVTANRRLELGHCAAYYYGVLRPSFGMVNEG